LPVKFDALCLRMTNDTPYDTRWLRIRQPFNYLRQQSAWPSDAPDSADVGTLEEVGDVSDLVAPALTTPEPEFNRLGAAATALPPSDATIHAVDWSGAGGPAARNAKIRYARWDFGNNSSSVTVLPATLSRNDILRMIRSEPGFWILDFPFGLPVDLMRAAGVKLNDLDATLAFTRGVRKAEFRDHCNLVWIDSGQRGSKHRATERAVGCGWFDWFVQLFRQTWTGQVEIVGALRTAIQDARRRSTRGQQSAAGGELDARQAYAFSFFARSEASRLPQLALAQDPHFSTIRGRLPVLGQATVAAAPADRPCVWPNTLEAAAAP
jgi:hypothetical protein